MAKIITIDSVLLKELNISKNEGLITIQLCYSLMSDDGKEYDQKRTIIMNSDLTSAIKTKINDLITFAETKLKVKEGIN